MSGVWLRLLGFVCVCLIGTQLVACGPSASLGAAPPARAARAYAQTLATVLSGGELDALRSVATTDQVERVGRYRMMLEGERGQLLVSRLEDWRATSLDGDSVGLAIVRAEEKWVSQPVALDSGAPIGPAQTRRIVVEYRLVLTESAWLVSELTELPAKGD